MRASLPGRVHKNCVVLGGFRKPSLERDEDSRLFLHRSHTKLATPTLGQHLFEQVIHRYNTDQ
jgi:hypothetical protein